MAFAKAWFKLTAPRHGPASRAIVGPEVPSGRSSCSGRIRFPRSITRLIDQDDVEGTQAEDPRTSGLDSGTGGRDRLGVGFDLRSAAQRQARRCQRCAHPSCTAERSWEVNKPEAAREGARERLEGIQREFNRRRSRGGKKVSLADHDRPRRLCGSRRARRRSMPATTSRCRSRRAGWMRRRSRPTSSRSSRPASRSRWFPQLFWPKATTVAERTCWSIKAQPADVDGAGDDRARRRLCASWRANASDSPSHGVFTKRAGVR